MRLAGQQRTARRPRIVPSLPLSVLFSHVVSSFGGDQYVYIITNPYLYDAVHLHFGPSWVRGGR